MTIIFIMAPQDSIAIRPFTSADMPQLQELHSALIPVPYPSSFFLNQLIQSNHLCLIAHDTSLVQGPVAFVTASLRKQGDMDQHIQLLTLGVLPSHQSKGIARRLVLQVVAALNPSSGQIPVHTHVCTTNTPGRHFYERLGMRLRMEDHHPVIARNIYSYSTLSRNPVQAWTNREQGLFRSRDAYFMEGHVHLESVQ